MQSNEISIDSQNNYVEDEIDLRELFNTIKTNIVKIAIFTILVTSFTLVYVLTIANSYKSEIILVAQDQAKVQAGGLSALAGFAGIDIGGSSGMSATDSLNAIIKDYSFNLYLIKKYKLDEKIFLNVDTTNFIYPFGLKLSGTNENNNDTLSKDDVDFNTYEILQSVIALSSDKKSAAITLSVEFFDRYFAKELVDIYLKESTNHLRKSDMLEINQKIKYYNEEISNTQNIDLKSQLNTLISSLIQKKVLAQASEFYVVKKITDSRVAYIKEKSKPKRSLILIVSFITSIILSIFGVFFLEFIRKND